MDGEYDLESRGCAESRRIDVLWPCCAALCLLGAVTGTVVFSRTFSDADIAAYIDAQRLLPTTFSEAFLLQLWKEMLVFAVEIVAAGFVLGWCVLPGVLFFRGLGVGVGVCCLCAGCELFGALYALAAIVLPTAIAFVAHTLLCRDSLRISFGIFFALFGKNKFGENIKGILVRIPLCAAVLVFSAALSAVLRINLHTIIS